MTPVPPSRQDHLPVRPSLALAPPLASPAGGSGHRNAMTLKLGFCRPVVLRGNGPRAHRAAFKVPRAE